MSRPENFANQAIHEISRVLMEFNFANQQDYFISWEIIFAKLHIPQQKYWKNTLKSCFHAIL